MRELPSCSAGELSRLLDSLFEGAFLVDGRRTILSWNPAAERITGYPGADVVGRSCSDGLLSHVDDAGESLCGDRCPLLRALKTGEARRERVNLHHSSGHRVPVVVRVLPLETPGGRMALQVFREDMALHTMRARLRDLEELSLVDAITGLGNRRFASREIARRIAERERYERTFGLLLIDVDDFRGTNEELGHDAGDRLLVATARTLMGVLRPFDAVCHWGGDQFLAVVGNVDSHGLSVIAERIRSIVESSSVQYDTRPVSATISVGGALSRRGEPAEGMLVRVDSLLYEAKKAGRNRIRID